ncbi:hypothetical protein CgunFtcFv8_009722 [Champsocephalus gunnari]|uniref:Uncharacterized protein n=2 Tax=Champsocephalus gunnari TaxID=52237 RepID=A0AAN8C552_CHAGU|nr:hypothetical protein CgunFtcFv8_009722 [Champsocephalus gunnari]
MKVPQRTGKDSAHHYKPAAMSDPLNPGAWPSDLVSHCSFGKTVKAIIHREKTRETLDSFTLLATDFHNSCPPTITSDNPPAVHSTLNNTT